MGLRQSEALGLTWDCVDLTAATIAITKSLQRHNGAYHLAETKTARSTPTIALPAELVPLLRAHKARQLEERLRAGPLWIGDDWDLVFATGGPLHGS